MNTRWQEEAIERYGPLPVWTATWHVRYVTYYRYRQTFEEADRLARKHAGQVLLPIRDHQPNDSGDLGQ